MRSLEVFLKDKRYDIVEEALQFAKHTCEEMGIPVVKRRTVQEDEYYARTESCRRAADFGPRTEKETELHKFMQSLVENYNELPADGILTEIPHLRRFLKAAKVPKEEPLGWTSLRFLEFVVEYELFDSVPNLT
ncbi:hypothetical protein AVEN_13266-1 [Araneus ventricosus]|uniref:Uncharacterized protein n=1 Tax=Araneus ventricosus TaxID=182803 RepID=A0A4Y1ZKT8_ARAVE|nr:hypothetical protein AVEN_13266-1 [Araneus ventricosus]